MPADGEILYRLLSGEEPRTRDFMSNWEKERARFPDEPYVVHRGVSMYEHADQALIKANRYPLSVGAVTLAAGMGFTLAKTYGVGHYTVWGDAEALLGQAASLAYVDEGMLG